MLEESVLKKEPGEHLYHFMRRAVAKHGGTDLELPPREHDREPPDFSGDEYKAYD